VRDLRHGAATAWAHPQLRILAVVTVTGWFMVNVFFVLEPLFVKDVLGRPGDNLLYLWSAHGAGALAGAIVLTRTRRTSGREAALTCAGVALIGLGIFVYTAVGIYGVALAASAVSGVGFALLFPPLLALIQRVIPEEQRGRVTSVFVAMQETAGLASSLALLVLGSLIVVRPTLVAAGASLTLIGLVGLRAVVRARVETTRDRAPA
jgi:Na+/melibiose symporter-like transporter